jgi:hypothetical protein
MTDLDPDTRTLIQALVDAVRTAKKDASEIRSPEASEGGRRASVNPS